MTFSCINKGEELKRVGNGLLESYSAIFDEFNRNLKTLILQNKGAKKCRF
jgi:hypothetical protein